MFRSTAYRHSSEYPILFVTLLLTLGVVLLTAMLTQCLSLLLILLMFAFTIWSTNAMQKTLMAKAFLVHPQTDPRLASIVETCHKRLKPGPLRVYIVRQQMVNAYTFGLSDPKSVVVCEPMLRVMSPCELSFVIGHEMGHVALGHTWLNTLVGGLAGSPSPYGIGYLVYLIFQWYSRACELSCDRAGLLACGNLNQAISALVRLSAPNAKTAQEFDTALARVDAEDDTLVGQLQESFQSHPLIIKRINALKAYAASPEYRQLQQAMDRNLAA